MWKGLITGGSSADGQAFEPLEARRVLSGVTILTHGYDASGVMEDWVNTMRNALETRAGAPGVDSRAYGLVVDDDGLGATLLDLRGQGAFAESGQGEAFMSVDWADASNNNIFPGLEPLVDTALAASRIVESLFLVNSEIGNAAALAQLPIHLIGHSRGAGVMVEVARQLGTRGIWVDQLTLLDPHPLTSADPIRSGGEDPAITLFSNTLYADNYFRTSNASWSNPAGESVLSAYNIDLSSLIFSHGSVHAAYHGTIDLAATSDGDGLGISSSWYGPTVLGPRATAGYYASRVAGGQRPSAGVLTELGGSAARPDPATSGPQWPNIANIQIALNATVRTGTPLAVPFVFGDRDSPATIHFYYDNDTNPYNGHVGDAGQVTMSQADFANGTVQITATGVPTGAYYLVAEADDGGRTRFNYAANQITVLAGFQYEAVFPEGFAADYINEFVPITNTNDVAVTYELHVRYETGTRDQLISTGTIPAHTRGGVTIAETRDPAATLVRKNEPYALVLRSTLPIAATFSHYDFGTTIGESFTYERSTEWTFGDGQKDDNVGRDFILVYNPSDTPVSVTLTLYTNEGITFTDTRTIAGQRRGGWSISDISEQRLGAYSARVTATAEIVASQSRYQPQRARGYGALGSADGGALAGIVPSIDFDDSFYATNGDDPSGVRYAADAFVSILNTNNVPATMTLHFFVDKIGQNDPNPIPWVVIAPARSRTTVSIRDLGLPTGREFGVVYRSNIPVTVSGSVYQGQDGTGTTASPSAATEWTFGEGYMDRNRAGAAILEDIYLFNPGATSLDVTVTFMFTDGSTLQVVKSLDARELDDLHVDQLAELTSRAEQQWFGVKVTAPNFFVAGMEHWDGGIGGGFQTLGTMGGSIASFANVLTL